MARLKGLDEATPIVRPRRRRRLAIFDPDAVGPNGEVLHRRFGEAIKVRDGSRAAGWARFIAVFLTTVVGLTAAQWWLDSFGFGSETVALRHVAAAMGCDAAYSVGLTPAKRGEPGYWRRLDGDGDGIACEIYTPGDLTAYRRYHPAREPGLGFRLGR